MVGHFVRLVIIEQTPLEESLETRVIDENVLIIHKLLYEYL